MYIQVPYSFYVMFLFAILFLSIHIQHKIIDLFYGKVLVIFPPQGTIQAFFFF